MFGIFKKKKTEIFSPADGQLINIDKVADPVFNQKMMGNGFAVKPENGEVFAPISGVVKSVFPTKHALIIEAENGLSVLVHVGLDTVELKGEGFTTHVEEGQKVSAGDQLLSVDLKTLAEKAKDNVIIVVFPDQPDLQLELTEKKISKKELAAIATMK